MEWKSNLETAEELMGVHSTPPRFTAGFPIGIIAVHLIYPKLPGNVANATTYPFPVLYREVTFEIEQLFEGDLSIKEDIIAAAKELEAQGVRAIIGACGYFAHFQQDVKEAVDVPVFLSSLCQLPMIKTGISEKKKIAEVVKAITDHILENNFHLADIDGIPTTWANWEPDLLNNDDRWYYERGTNSLEMLSFLKTTYHVTGDEKYNKVFDMLIKKHHYAMNCMQYKVEDNHVAHIDDQLDFTNIYPLIAYTDNEAQKEIFKMGLTHHWEYERVERSPFFNIVYGALTNNNCDIENAAKSLAEMNLDMIQWPAYNSYRPDIEWDTAQEAMGVPPQLKSPIEYYSRAFSHYDGNPFVCDSGAEEFVNINNKRVTRTVILPSVHTTGMSAAMPYIYLLPYWMGRYHGLLGD